MSTFPSYFLLKGNFVSFRRNVTIWFESSTDSFLMCQSFFWNTKLSWCYQAETLTDMIQKATAMKEVKNSHHYKWPLDCNYLYVLFICFNLFLKGLETPMLSIPICEILPQSLSLSAPQLLSLPSCASTSEILGGGDPHIEIQSGICRSKSNLLLLLFF